ncbi:MULTISPECIES: hypothetical protein [unclassified Shigella]|uniref:hypothetical protein n=1 Tax=unclassified Shigella TaxID=2629414 RepID=UPI0025705500|nr:MULTISPECIES: hypothetical protein [unclassified Shigella]
MIQDFNHKLDKHNKEISNQAYSKGLQVLLGDILNFAIQYQEKLAHYEFQQREQLTTTIAQFFNSPEIQTEIIHRLISAIPSEKKLRSIFQQHYAIILRINSIILISN